MFIIHKHIPVADWYIEILHLDSLLLPLPFPSHFWKSKKEWPFKMLEPINTFSLFVLSQICERPIFVALSHNWGEMGTVSPKKLISPKQSLCKAKALCTRMVDKSLDDHQTEIIEFSLKHTNTFSKI